MQTFQVCRQYYFITVKDEAKANGLLTAFETQFYCKYI
jgi:hypothetical protein